MTPSVLFHSKRCRPNRIVDQPSGSVIMKMSTADSSSRHHFIILGFLLLIQLAVTMPLLSWAGFPPLDDGFQLAYSRRILNGEVPHRDFISIRPVLTPLIHTIDLLISDEYTFRVSRTIVLIEYALIVFFTCLVFEKKCRRFSLIEKIIITAIGLMLLMDYSFFGIAWYTVDALLLGVTGLYFLQSENRTVALIGFFLTGLSPLAKQSFGLFPLSAIAMSKPGRRLESLVAVGIGPLIYLLAMLYFGALNDFIVQLRSQSQISYLLSTGCRPIAAAVCLIAGYSTAYFASRFQDRGVWPRVVLFLSAIVFITLPLAWSQVSPSKSWFTFYFLIGWFLRSNPLNYGFTWISVIVPLVLAWSSSLSFFHSTVAFFGFWLFAMSCHVIFLNQQQNSASRFYFIITSCLVVLVVFISIRTRSHTITFMEPAISSVTYPLDGIVPGAKGIYTSEKNYAMYRDIRDAADLLQSNGLNPIVLPYVTFWNVMHKSKNPVAIDWPYYMELGNDHLRGRFEKSVVALIETHGIVMQTDPMVSEKYSGKAADAYNLMWRRILDRFPNKRSVGDVIIYTSKPIDDRKPRPVNETK